MSRTFVAVVAVVAVLVGIAIVATVAIALSQRDTGSAGIQSEPSSAESLRSTAPVVAFYGDS